MTRSLPMIALVVACGLVAVAPARADLQRMKFEQAVNTALDRNPSAAIAKAEIARAQALIEQTRSASLPTIAANVNYTLLDNDRVIADRIVAAQSQVQVNGVATVPVLQPARWGAWARGKDNVAIAEWTSKDQRRIVAIATARSYLTVLAQQRALLTSEQALTTAKAHADFARQRFTGGVGNRLDLVRAEQELAASEAQLVNTKVALLRSQEALGVLLGIEAPVDADGEPHWSNTSSEGNSDVRADVRAADARVYAARHARKHNWLDFLPTANLAFTPFFQDPPTINNPRLGWQLTANVNWLLYDGGFRYGVHKERRVLERQSVLQLEATQRQATAEVRVAKVALQGAIDALTAAKRSTDLMHEALDLANVAYRAGATTNLEVIDAERRARDADIASIVAEDAARQAKLELLSSQGLFP